MVKEDILNEMYDKYEFEFEGITPLRFNKPTQNALKSIASGKKAQKITPDEMRKEAKEQKIYKNSKGLFVPNHMLWATIKNAALEWAKDNSGFTKTQMDIDFGSKFIIENMEMNLLTLKNKEIKNVDKIIEYPSSNSNAQKGGSSVLVIVYLPQIDKWKFKVNISIQKGFLSSGQLKQILDISGMNVGLGTDRKRRFGRFIIT